MVLVVTGLQGTGSRFFFIRSVLTGNGWKVGSNCKISWLRLSMDISSDGDIASSSLTSTSDPFIAFCWLVLLFPDNVC